MQRFLFFIVAVLVAAHVKPANSVVTPSVTIKEENPPRGSNRIRTNADGNIEIIALVGQPLALECIPRDVADNAKVFWKWQDPNNKNNFFHINTDMRSNDISKYKITKGTSAKNAIRLELPTVNPSSAGFLICQVLYQEENSVTATRLIKVYAYPRIQQYLSSFEISAREGRNTTMNCNATGIPPPKLYWMRIGGSNPLIRNYGRRYFGGKIVFQKTQPADRGLYRCEAINLMGMVSWNVQLNVQFKPIVEIYTPRVGNQVLQKVGCRIQLECKVTGNPRPLKGNMRWTNGKGQDVISEGTRVGTYVMEAADFTTYFLINFYRTEASDFGRYTCSATNEFGTGSAAVDFAASDVGMSDRSGRVLCSANHLSVSIVLLFIGCVFALRTS